MGYGVPNLERATTNTSYRVTLITSGVTEIPARQAHIYRIIIPEEIRDIGEEYDILIEVTLSYTAKPRRTRKKIRGYLSVWLDWMTSNIGETIQSFANRALKGGHRRNVRYDRSIPWKIGQRDDWGQAQGARRSSATLQKDWATIPSNQLAEGFYIAVTGHPGWDRDPASVAKYSLVVSFEAINRDIEIYERIRAEIEARIEEEVEIPGF
jgi:hypothetical protein